MFQRTQSIIVCAFTLSISHNFQIYVLGADIRIFFLIFIYLLFIWLHWVLVAARWLLSCGMGTLSSGMHVGSSSLTRDRTQAPCIGSTES